MQKLLSIFVYLILLIFLESAAEVTGVPASAPAELPEEPNYVASPLMTDPGGAPPPGCWTVSGSGGPALPSS